MYRTGFCSHCNRLRCCCSDWASLRSSKHLSQWLIGSTCLRYTCSLKNNLSVHVYIVSFISSSKYAPTSPCGTYPMSYVRIFSICRAQKVKDPSDRKDKQKALRLLLMIAPPFGALGLNNAALWSCDAEMMKAML